MSWLSDKSCRDELLAQHTQAAPLFDEFYQSLWRQAYIDPQVLELCRLRLAQLHQCEVEWQRSEIAVPSEKKAALGNAEQANLSAAEQACLAYTEVYAMDASSVTDELAEAVKAHYGDAGLVALMTALGIFDGMTRMSLLWQLQQV